MDTAEKLGDDAGLRQACRALGVSRASFYRRRRRKESPTIECQARPSPRALSALQRERVREVLNSERFMDKAPREVYATLLDEGEYLCSVRTMYRILNENKAVRERRNQLRHPNYKKPELLASGANQVWSWDITKLLGPEKWTYYYLYVILDIYSRYVTGWMLAHRESSNLASRLIRETVENQEVCEDQLTIHSDRGPSMASLGVTKSHSRPHVSNDNPFSESQFKTMKYRPEYRPFDAGDAALRRGASGDRSPQASSEFSLRQTSRAFRARLPQAPGAANGCLDQPTADQHIRRQKRASRDGLSPKARCAFDAPSTWLSLIELRGPQRSTPFHQATSNLTVRMKSYNPFEHPSHA